MSPLAFFQEVWYNYNYVKGINTEMIYTLLFSLFLKLFKLK